MSYTVTIVAGTATVVLTGGTLSGAAAQTLVEGINYQNTSVDNPSAGNRVFTLTQIKDSGGTANGGVDTTTLSIASTVTVAPVNDLPVGVSESYSAVEGVPVTLASVLSNDSDLESPLSVLQVATNGSSAAVAVNGTNVVTTALGGTVVMNTAQPPFSRKIGLR